MKRRWSQLFAAVSAALLATSAPAGTRPLYGGTLRVEMRAAPAQYWPLRGAGEEQRAREHIAALVFDRLVTLDAQERPVPALATAWQMELEGRRWHFQVRPALLHNGAALAPRLIVASLAESLAAADPDIRVQLNGDEVVVESPTPHPDLLYELALVRNSVAARASDGAVVGSGPFRVAEWQAGRHAVLVANEEYWGGRPYLDAIDILMGRSLRDQELDFRLARADAVEAPLGAAPQVQEGVRVASAPVELVGVECDSEDTAEQERLCRALSLAVDRDALYSVILQRQGEAAGGLLPQWISGYAFLFSTRAQIERARQAVAGSAKRSLALAYDGADPLARALAERVAVNARDAGITVQPVAETATSRVGNAGARIATRWLESPAAAVALQALATSGARDAAGLSTSGQLPALKPDDSYGRELSLLQRERFVPLVFLPESWNLGTRVRGWESRRDGAWPLADTWLETRLEPRLESRP